MLPKELPSYEVLNEYFEYDKSTGILVTKKKLANRCPKGSVVGSKSSEGYLRVCFKGKHYPIHRIIWKLVTKEEPVIIDHINHVKDDNRFENLRSVTYQINNINRLTTKGYTILPNGTFRVTFLGVDIGYFYDEKEASAVAVRIRDEYSRI